MRKDTNNKSAKPSASIGGALGAIAEEIAVSDLYTQTPNAGKLWRRMKRGKVQSNISGAVNALDSLLHQCRAQGPYIPFRPAMVKPEHDSNRAALALICLQLGMVATYLEEAEGEYLVNLRVELAELERHLSKTS